MIGIVDYGLGNVQAIINIYNRLGIPVFKANVADELAMASHIVLPGVGSFDWAINRLELSGMRSKLDELVLCRGRPVLGICVGMQIFANHSEEGHSEGLGWVAGEVKRFDHSLFSTQTCLPHMGWNDVRPIDHPLFAGIKDPRFYFLHSYYFSCVAPDMILADADYGLNFAASVGYANILGVQFHPEKSHHWGVQLLKNFAHI